MHFHSIIFVSLIVSLCYRSVFGIVLVNKCQNSDGNFIPLDGKFNGRDIRVPRHLSVSHATIHFSLTDKDVQCAGTTKESILTWQDKDTSQTNPVRSTLSEKLPNAFYNDGRFRFEMKYYITDEYCISGITEENIIVRLCEGKCSDENPCINKCCDVHQVLNHEHRWLSQSNFTPQCDDSGGIEWKPIFYSSAENTVATVNENKKYRLKKTVLTCYRPDRIPLSTLVRNDRNTAVEKIPVKMLENGTVYHMEDDKQWRNLAYKGEYCIDGIQKFDGSGYYTGRESDQMVLLCPSESNSFEYMKRRNHIVSEVYSGAYFFSSIFLLLMVLIHLVLLDKKNRHGLTVFSYALTMFLMYTFYGVTHCLNFLRKDREDAKVEWDCFILAILVHYLHLATFSWLTVMNYDLWRTFRSVKISTPKSATRSYKIYCVFAWLLPAVVVALCVAFDVTINKINNPMMLPSYGINGCSVDYDSLGPYLYYVLALILGFNIVLIILTFISFYHIKSTRSDAWKSWDKFSLWKIFLRLFLVMGVAWTFEILSWIYLTAEFRWYWCVVDILVILQAVAVFAIYCCNDRTIAQLESKYPGGIEKLKHWWCCCCLRRSSNEENVYILSRKAKRKKVTSAEDKY